MEIADIAIVGSGIASTATVIKVFRKLIAESHRVKPVSITIFERHHEFWLGTPYGGRSSVNALTITSIYDFFTNDDERVFFFDWFRDSKAELFDWYLENGGLTAARWFEKNKKALESEDWKHLYLPRFIFGRYFSGIADSLLKIVEDEKLASVTFINAEVTDVSPLDDGLYQLSYETPGEPAFNLTAVKVVIATGSAPARDFAPPVAGDYKTTFINNLYEPGIKQNLRKLEDALKEVENNDDANVLIVGTNASSIEFLYLLSGLPDVTTAINKVVLISKSGLLPHHISDETLDNYPIDNLEQLTQKGTYTIKELIEATLLDIQPAVKGGVILPYIDRILARTFKLIEPLDEEDKKLFLAVYGMQLSNSFRRSGTDYKGGETYLREIHKLTILKGSFLNIEQTEHGGQLNYTDMVTNELQKYPTPFKVVINCTGASDLAQSSGRLIYNMVHKNIAKVNLSGKGFYVNEKFEAATNLYIMGPLLGGNKNELIHFWHLENASRLIYLAPFLAEHLLKNN